ncbi:MAG TPA: hypothetical protein VH250_11625, partial [Granulicella sp.]|nr:hypothetical protein [Granulicella sp.]
MPRIAPISVPTSAAPGAIKITAKGAKPRPSAKPGPASKSPAKSTNKPVTAATAKQRMLKQLVCSDAPEQALRHRGFLLIAGVDEVGRGALFGPVVAAAVILPESIEHLARA